jgi:hypothetical protein
MLLLCVSISLWFSIALFYAPWGKRAYGSSWPGYENHQQRRRLLFIQQRATTIALVCITLTGFLQSFRNEAVIYMSLFFLGMAFCITVATIGLCIYTYTYYPPPAMNQEDK